MNLLKSSRTGKSCLKLKETSDSTTRKIFGLAASYEAFTIFLDKAKLFLACVVYHSHQINQLLDGTINQIHHFAFSSTSDSNDIFTLSQVLKRDDEKKFAKSMVKEVKVHEDRDYWENMPKSA